MLDSEETIHSWDRRDMLGTIGKMPSHLLEGLKRGRMSGPPKFTPSNMVICGMGGSAIGGDLLGEWLSHVTSVPIEVRRSYSMPLSVSKGSLVIVASYSGNTEETLSMLEDSRRRGAKVVAISSGGKLAEICESVGIPFARVASGLVPRASLGYMFGAMAGIVEHAGIAPVEPEFAESFKVLGETSRVCAPSAGTIENPAKRLAHELFGTVPVVAGYGISSPVAKRWANQLSENGKAMAFSTELPEMGHNEIVGWMRDPRSQGFSAVFLEHDLQTPAMQRRLKVTKAMMSRRSSVFSVRGSGACVLAQMLSLVMVGDYVSAYLGVLRNEDPSSTEPIEELKAALANK